MSAHAIFSRARDRLLANMGENGRLRESIACSVAVEHGVEIQGEYGEVILTRDVVRISKALAPVSGDKLETGDYDEDLLFVPTKTYFLDGKIADDGYFVRYSLLDA